MLRAFFASIFALIALLATSRSALADEPKGMVVVATDGATDAAWPLAQGVYGSKLLRPAAIDDAHARVLAGEAAPSDELKEIAELRAGVKGDDAASRQVLSALAQKLGVRSIIVVSAGDPPTARVYDDTTHTFDAAQYTAEKGDWTKTVRSLERPFETPLVTLTEPTKPVPAPKKSESKSFWESPWFWVAIGSALLIGGGVLIATNVQSSDTIHMQLRLP